MAIQHSVATVKSVNYLEQGVELEAASTGKDVVVTTIGVIWKN